eukprot:TRINITY_DN2149_c0_g1_i1.p1 TRINITY_DN2149_c0_g1~~TRINITY_DN2149_c0_g1_i1.p1  ORF type:complete len:116 (-),score=26.32 TRINITY_DN2149_c0_g1_i1:228-575(-)
MKTRILITVILFFITSRVMAMPQVKYDEDLDEVQAAMAANQISPFVELLAIIERDYKGRVIRVELEREDDYGDNWIYELKILDEDRNVLKADFDAKTFRLLKIKGHKLERFFKDH